MLGLSLIQTNWTRIYETLAGRGGAFAMRAREAEGD
jgi:hypothetical protein